jgi:hypothetical protein
MRWRKNRLHLILMLIFDVLALATWSLPAGIIGTSLTGWLAFRVWRWNSHRSTVQA